MCEHTHIHKDYAKYRYKNLLAISVNLLQRIRTIFTNKHKMSPILGHIIYFSRL